VGRVRDDDERWMRRCLELAAKAEGRTAPNPIVGCVIIRDGEVIAEGWHERAGSPHAEASALLTLGGRAEGATLYVNLEPCDHQGRTPPCSRAVAASGVSRVVIGLMDPLPEHTGGAARLRRAGIDVVKGVLAAECAEANRPWLTYARTGRPYVLCKAGVSLDGKIATHRGESRWITSVPSRAEVHALRNRLDAVLVGVGTVRADDPELTCRLTGGRNPMRVVVDSYARTPLDAAVLRRRRGAGAARVVIACTAAAPAARIKRLEAKGAEVWVLPHARKRVELDALLGRLGREGVIGLLVEGGAEIHASFVQHRLADELRLYVAPIVIGGGNGPTAGPPWSAGTGVARLTSAVRYQFAEAPRRLGDDVVLVARRREDA